MNPRIKKWLTDIQLCIFEINQFLPDKMNFKQFQRDIKTKRAVERNLEIIGECVKRILHHSGGDIKINQARRIVNFRNKLAHEYDAVSDEIVWAIVLRELPKLEEEVIDLLKDRF